MVLATVLPLREFDTQLALDILSYHQQRNHAAYLSHRKRRIALVERFVNSLQAIAAYAHVENVL
jgi:hypothetical protein